MCSSEIGRSGEVRPVSQSDVRLKEAAKLGFERALCPTGGSKRTPPLAIENITAVHELVALFDQPDKVRAAQAGDHG